MSVHRGYVSGKRVLVNAAGQVFAGKEWAMPAERPQRIAPEYERWKDVPQAWIGVVPFWTRGGGR
jgi:hypothetical protein